jgi:hypothetical protein
MQVSIAPRALNCPTLPPAFAPKPDPPSPKDDDGQDADPERYVDTPCRHFYSEENAKQLRKGESDPDDPLLKLNCTPNSTAQYRGMRTGADAYPPSDQASRAALVDRSNRFRYAPRPCHDHRGTARWAPIIAN